MAGEIDLAKAALQSKPAAARSAAGPARPPGNLFDEGLDAGLKVSIPGGDGGCSLGY